MERVFHWRSADARGTRDGDDASGGGSAGHRRALCNRTVPSGAVAIDRNSEAHGTRPATAAARRTAGPASVLFASHPGNDLVH